MMNIIRVNPLHPEPAVIQTAADCILSGGLIAFPTETVYGLGADGTDPDAVQRIYEVKGRPVSKPILILIDDQSLLEELTVSTSDQAHAVMKSFWPGPLTLVFQAAPQVRPELTGGGSTIGIRHTASPVAAALCRACNRPITAPSANLSGSPDPLTAEAAAHDLGDTLDLVLDGGPSPESMPSTVVDVSTDELRLIRPGPISFDAITEVWSST